MNPFTDAGIAMGNEKANSYWEAQVPTNYDRVAIENFIRAKYVLTYSWLKQSFNLLFCNFIQGTILCFV